MQNQNDKTKSNYTIRISAFPSYVLLLIIFGPAVFLLIANPNLVATVIVCGIVAWLLYYFNSLNIFVFEDRLVFRRKSIAFSDVKRISMIIDLGVMYWTPFIARHPC